MQCRWLFSSITDKEPAAVWGHANFPTTGQGEFLMDEILELNSQDISLGKASVRAGTIFWLSILLFWLRICVGYLGAKNVFIWALTRAQWPRLHLSLFGFSSGRHRNFQATLQVSGGMWTVEPGSSLRCHLLVVWRQGSHWTALSPGSSPACED